jgi:hypothetical protein
MFAFSSRWAACSSIRLTPTGVAQPLPNRTMNVRAIVELTSDLLFEARDFFKSYELERSVSVVADMIRVAREAKRILITPDRAYRPPQLAMQPWTKSISQRQPARSFPPAAPSLDSKVPRRFSSFGRRGGSSQGFRWSSAPPPSGPVPAWCKSRVLPKVRGTDRNTLLSGHHDVQ